MATLTVTNLKTELLALINDNATGDITPADVRQILTDIIDSVRRNDAVLLGSNTSMDVTTTPVALATGQFTAATADSGMGATVSTGVIQSFNQAGFDHDGAFSFTISGTANRVITFEVYRNGVPTGLIYSVTLPAGGRPASGTLTAFVPGSTTSASEQLTLRASADAATTITIGRITFRLTRVVTN